MEANQVSITARGTAFMRAYHAAHDHPKIFDDFLAHQMITEEERRAAEERHLKAFERFDPGRAASCPDRAKALACWMQTGTALSTIVSRARYTEDNLANLVRRQEVEQYVILGAGMDTFAWRRPDLLERLKVFEVDHPATQAHKRQRLREAGLKYPVQLHFIPVDFSRENLATTLRRSAYDPQAPSFFSWLGVTYYLSREAVFATLRAIAAIALSGSTVIFDYMDADAFVPGKASRRMQFLMEIVKRVGEPMLTGFDPANLGTDLAPLGLRLHEELGPADIQRRFFEGRQDGYHAGEHAHFAWAEII
jgi:methyltransferase (TIGR00027 family)